MKINMHTSHPSAFISSTFNDLQEERNSVAEVLKMRGLNVNALDIKPASTQSSKREILSGIRESDFIILIIGDRYGSILKSMTGSETLSITWWEYARALRFGKPVLAYFKNVDANELNSHDDPSEQTYKRKRFQFQRFKKIVSNRHNPGYFSYAYELADKIDESLISVYRDGVRTLWGKITDLEADNSRLKTMQVPTHGSAQLSNTTPYLGINSLNGLLGGAQSEPMQGIANPLRDLLSNKK